MIARQLRAPAPLRVLCVLGTRPEAIKMAPVLLGMAAQPARFRAALCITGQHREMLSQVLRTFDLKPQHRLDVMRPNQALAGLTGRILDGLDRVLRRQAPDLVMVQGDTTTAFAAALAAFYRGVPVAHVEAGLRTGDWRNPFPEELNRALIDRFADFCFAPTSRNTRTLREEGVPANRIFLTGNTGIDALLMVRARARARGAGAWRRLLGDAMPAVRDTARPVVLITAHRRESFGARLNTIFGAIRSLALRHPEWSFVFPVHLNPNVRRPASRLLRGVTNVHLIEPLPYEPFVLLMDRASLILTDSGGIQEEAPSLGKPVVVMRETTERQEALQAGTIVLAGNTGHGLVAIAERMMSSRRGSKARKNPYGDGRAAERILRILWRERGRP